MYVHSGRGVLRGMGVCGVGASPRGPSASSPLCHPQRAGSLLGPHGLPPTQHPSLLSRGCGGLRCTHLGTAGVVPRGTGVAEPPCFRHLSCRALKLRLAGRTMVNAAFTEIREAAFAHIPSLQFL